MNQNRSEFDSSGIFAFFWQFRVLLIIAGLSGSVMGAVFSSSWFITPLYESTVVFYPATVNSISKALLSDNPSDKTDVLEFGAEEQSDQLIQILHSDDIRDSVIRRFNLMKHYEIPGNAEFRYTRLNKKYDKLIQFKRTEYMSVEITVRDKDPRMAADIANTIASLLDLTKNKIQREQADKSFQIVQTQYNSKKAWIEQLNDSLNFFRSQGIFDYDLQTDHLTELQVQSSSAKAEAQGKLSILRQLKVPESDTGIINNMARLKGSEASLLDLNRQLKSLERYGGAYNSVKEQLEKENEELVKIRMRYDRSKVDLEEVLPVKFLVNSARPAEKKVYPVRWLAVVLAGTGTVLLAALGLIIMQNIRAIRG
jgi:capsular polysaccharide biosynthesis protein